MAEGSVEHKEIHKMFADINGVASVDISDVIDVRIIIPKSGTAILKEVFDKELEFRQKYPQVLFDLSVR